MATTRRSDVTATAALRMAGAIRRKTFAAACTAAVRMAGASQRRAAYTAAWGRADAVAMAPGVPTGPGRSARNV